MVYPEELKKKALTLNMKTISSCWRDYKTWLRAILRKGENLFETYKDQRVEDWELFISRTNLEQFQNLS